MLQDPPSCLIQTRSVSHVAPDASPDATRRGICLMILAMFLMASMDAVSKHLTRTYPIPQLLWVRYGLFVVFAMMVARRRGVVASLQTSCFWKQVLRSLLSVAEIATFILAFRYLPLAEAHAMGAIAPLLAMGLAVPLLKERVGVHQWIAVAIGFLGVLVMLSPGSGMVQWAAFIPLLGAVLWALYQVMVRLVSRTDGAETTLLYTAMVGAVVLTGIAPSQWRLPDAEGWMWLILSGLLGSCAHYTLIKALQAAPASTLQPFTYTLMLWAAVMGFLVFGSIPSATTILGAALVAASGLYALRQ